MENLNLDLLSTVEQRAAEAASKAVFEYSNAIQAHMEAKAAERHYDSVQSAVSYRGDPNPQFAAEAEALFVWRSAGWTYATTELDKVTAGQRDQPGVEELVGELPAFVWP
ncbi:hypothetical protein OIU34_38725 [Pararhizobium sp. BT-229]|uniref:hypothetical protein n=1 Tax=Pararhizobium sp. BT-229 TaxID=2986923 RepID=UPI0021F71A58|nr:hypothetical protein [Pararhizobium sp. BT-229]MCV9967757.1 hypothetical protein [Pararhizobium sp. BT-229]